jgi:hypothetical protein
LSWSTVRRTIAVDQPIEVLVPMTSSSIMLFS